MVLAHAFVTGAPRSDSERDISVGGVQSVAVETFDGVDYAALGHLHGRHTLAPGVRYSGSPLAYSFSERDQVKGSWLVELERRRAGQRRVRRGTGPAAAGGDLRDPRRLLHDATRFWRCRGRPGSRPRSPTHSGRSGRWSGCSSGSPTRWCSPSSRAGGRHGDAAEVRRRSLGRTDAEIVADFFADVAGRPITRRRGRRSFSSACEACRVSADAAS